MKARLKYVLTGLSALLLGLLFLFAPQTTLAQAGPAFSQQELDQMLAPIALYPDALLSQVLMASTYPAEIVEAARWSRRNPGLDGDRAVRAVEWIDWDPSVKSLVAFPQILARMDENLDWTQRLGDAFLAQQADVMDSVQYLRHKAYTAGNLGSTEQFRVGWQGQAIVIDLVNPEVIYVPYYNPTVVYGTWWWPTYQPVRWASWPGYYVRSGVTRGFAWGPGIQVSRNFFFGAADWHRRSVTVVNVNNYYYNPAHARPHTEITRSTSNVWQHNPAGRRDVPYRDASVRQPSDVSPRQVVANLGARPNLERTPGSSNVPAVSSQPEMRSATRQPTVPASVSRTNVEQRPAAVDGVGHNANAAKSNARRPASHQVTAPGDSTVPASQPSGNVAASMPASSAAAPQPAGNARGNGGVARHQQ